MVFACCFYFLVFKAVNCMYALHLPWWSGAQGAIVRRAEIPTTLVFKGFCLFLVCFWSTWVTYGSLLSVMFVRSAGRCPSVCRSVRPSCVVKTFNSGRNAQTFQPNVFIHFSHTQFDELVLEKKGICLLLLLLLLLLVVVFNFVCVWVNLSFRSSKHLSMAVWNRCFSRPYLRLEGYTPSDRRCLKTWSH